MGIEATGRVHMIGPTEQKSERFTKREFVLEIADNPKYPQLVQFQATGDRCSQLDSVSVGDTVRVEFSLRGREWRSPSGDVKYFNSLDVWRVEAKTAAPRAATQSRAATSGTSDRTDDPRPGDVDDLPFTSADMAHEPTAIAKVLR